MVLSKQLHAFMRHLRESDSKTSSSSSRVKIENGEMAEKNFEIRV